MSKSKATILALLYVISPIDIIPDVIPVLGWLDDIGVLGLLVAHLTKKPPPSLA